MITIFVVLGLAFLVGGAGAIIDGWPYLMIERGFTQVIIGTIAVTGGVILLALSRVLAELRRVRTALGAAALLSAAPALEPEPRSPAPEMPAPSAAAASTTTAALDSALAGAALGGAGASFAAALEREEDRGAVAAEAGAGERADQEKPWPEAIERPPERPAEAASGDAADAAEREKAPDQDEAAERLHGASESEAEEAGDREEALELEEASAESASPQPVEAASQPVPSDEGESESEDQSWPQSGPSEPEPTRDADLAPPAPQERKEAPAGMWWPRVEPPLGAAAARPPDDHDDDLASLRDHLTRGPLAPEPPRAPAVGTGEKTGDDDLAAAGSWMTPALGRREPTFSEPVEDAALAGEEAPSPATATGSGAETSPERPEQEPSGEIAEQRGEADDRSEHADDPGQRDEPARPAASDEGVVGAYQVGDTHFTMFADGSIKARTPEGEYSFASMEELKAYLASEKSRLGV